MICIAKQSGMTLIGAIFIMVVLSAIGVYVVSLNAMQHSGTSMTLQANRALYAAESGMEWAAWYIRRGPNQNSCPANGTSFSIENFTVTIENCVETTVTEGTNNYKLFDLKISALTTGRTFGDSDYSSRTLLSRIEGP